MSSLICIPNMTLPACKVVEKPLTKKCYGITEGRTDGRTDGRMDGRTDGMTDRCKPVNPLLFQSGGIISKKTPKQTKVTYFKCSLVLSELQSKINM